MRIISATWNTALGLLLVAAVAMAHTPGHATARGPAAVVPRAQAPSGLAEPDAGDEDDGMERMDGPDAWERMGMGPHGLIRRGPGGQPRGGQAMRLHALRVHRRELERRLAVTPAQHERIEAILDRQLRSGIEQRARLQIAVLDLRSLMTSGTANRAAIESKIEMIARMRAELTKARLGALLDVRSVLTPEQQQKLHALHADSDDEDGI